MDIRIERYKDAMYKSRLIGIAATLILPLCVVNEISAFYFALSVNENVGGVAIQKALLTVGYATLIGIIALWRAFVLAWSRSHSYGWQLFSWWILAVSLTAYIVRSALLRQQNNMVCDGNGVCFGIYDMSSRTDFVLLVGTIFLFLSVFRFAATVAYVLMQNRLK